MTNCFISSLVGLEGSSHTSFMEVTNLTDAKNRLSELVEKARGGEPVRILVRGVAAVDLVPVRGASSDDDEERRLAELERRGVLRRGSGVIPDFVGRAVRSAPIGPLVSDAVLEDREDRC